MKSIAVCCGITRYLRLFENKTKESALINCETKYIESIMSGKICKEFYYVSNLIDTMICSLSRRDRITKLDNIRNSANLR